jgi:hypothetical protein
LYLPNRWQRAKTVKKVLSSSKIRPEKSCIVFKNTLSREKRLTLFSFIMGLKRRTFATRMGAKIELSNFKILYIYVKAITTQNL